MLFVIQSLMFLPSSRAIVDFSIRIRSRHTRTLVGIRQQSMSPTGLPLNVSYIYIWSVRIIVCIFESAILHRFYCICACPDEKHSSHCILYFKEY